MAQTEADTILESWLKQMGQKKAPSNYVGEAVPDVQEKKQEIKKHLDQEMQANIARGSESVIKKVDGQTVMDSAPISVGGVAADIPAAPAPQKEVPPPAQKPSIRDLIPKDEPAEEVAEQPAAPQPQKSQPVKGPQYDRSFPWDRALIGATPLLVGLLTGNQLEGAEVAANHLVKDEGDLYKRERDLAGKLAEMQAKREAEGVSGGKRRFTAQNIALNDGTTVKATFDSFTGKYLMPDGSEIPSKFIRSGFAVTPEEFDRRKAVSSAYKRDDADYLSQNTKVDPRTGELAIIREGRAIPIEGQNSGQLNKKQEGDIKDAVKEFTSSAPYKDATQALALAPQVSSLLDAAERSNDPNSIAGSSVVLTMIRQAQRVGVASDRDAAAMGGTEQWAESIKRIEEKLLGSGKPLTARDIQDLREISGIYSKRAKDLLGQFYGDKKQSYADRYHIAPEIIDQHIGADVRPYMSTAEKPIRAKNAPVRVNYKGMVLESPDREQTLLIEVNGQPVWTNATWEEVKKEFPNAKRLN